ncbi:TIGR02453 family protein [uncultured Arthrobacter sp.]|uniref:TIGR02453 family protein n=1 Tax=uncultured Arthrobacter sp. TaxID=114050 RepID=UPI0032164EEF
MRWTVYLLRCADGSLYTGIATDPGRRIEEHNAGRGAAYTRARRPVTLAYQESAPDRPAALRREWALKQLTRAEKEKFIMARASVPRDAGGARFAGFRPRALSFLRQLKRHNTRPWFEANRAVYESDLREPMRALVEEVDVALATVAPEIIGDPRRSMFRIHRDVRFSKDKSPYKTNAAVWFFHADAGKGVGSEANGGGAGFYFQLAPDECFLGGGIWMPPRPALARIRERLAEDQRGFEQVVLAPGFRRRFGALDEETMLTRLPRGVAPGHPAARWLRYQSFTVGRQLTEAQALSPRLVSLLARDFAALAPLVRWLNLALPGS